MKWDIYRPLLALKPSLGIVNRADYLCELASGNRVLHVGCAAAPLTLADLQSPLFLHRRLVEASADCHGVDNDDEAAEMLRAAGFENIRTADATELPQLTRDRFDLIVMGEVLEHVADPGSLLRQMPKMLTSSGRIVITVPNAYNLFRFLHMFVGREVVHMDHVAYYSPKTLTAACSRAGLTLEQLAFTDPFGESEGARTHRLIATAYGVVLKIRPYLGQSVVGVFRLTHADEPPSYKVLA
jgi:2-polyprenyl-3-methyl-5-hydroxy-6-metoxy-1,4-benzoquinol methylase